MPELDISPVAAKLRLAHARRRRIDFSSFWAFAVSGMLLSFSVLFALDYLTRFPGVARVAMSLAILAFFLVVLPLWNRRRRAMRPDLLAIAKEVERKASAGRMGFNAVLVSATEFALQGSAYGSPELRRNVVAQAGDSKFDPAAVKLHDVVLLAWARRLLAAFAAVYLLWGLLGHDSMRVFFLRAAGLPERYMTRTRIVKAEAPKSGPQYVGVQIKVEASGVLPAKGAVSLKFEGEPAFDVALEQQGKGERLYLAEVRAPAKSFSYSVKLGDDRSQEGFVAIVKPPCVESGRVSIRPPGYTGLKERSQELGSFEMLEGSALQIEITPDREVAVCALELGKSLVEGVKSGKGYVFKGLSVKDSSRYSVKLADKDGVDNFDRISYSISILRDRPPEVSLQAPENGSFYAPSSRMKWAVKASDDYGIFRMELRYSITKRVERGELVETVKIRDGGLPLGDFDKTREASPSGALRLSELNVEPGQSVEFRAVAFDGFPGRQEDALGSSQPMSVNIVTAEELRRIIEEDALQVHQLLKDVSSDMKRQKTSIEMILKEEGR